MTTFTKIEEALKHMSPDFEGFYSCGMKFNKDTSKIECVCGDQFDEWIHASDHLDIHKNAKSCYDKKINIDDFSCKKCNVVIKSHSHYLLHINTIGHKRENHDLHCEVCDTTCRTPKEIETHLKSKKHINNSNGVTLHCSTCNITCRGHKELEKHKQTTKHNKNLIQKENGKS